MVSPAPYLEFQAADEEEWLDWRRGGIGSSDSPAILGVCPHHTRLGVYLSKIHRGPDRTARKACQVSGNDLEPLIAKWYTDRTGHAMAASQKLLESTIHPWMRASVDFIRDDGRAVECKALGVFKANEFRARDGEWEALPQNYIVQCHHQMIVLDADVIDMAVFYPLELRVYTIPRSERLCNLIVDLTGELWECVCDGTPPRTVDARDADRLEAAYPKAEGEILLTSDELVAAADEWFRFKIKEAKVKLLDAMGEAASASLPSGDVIRRVQKHVKGYIVPDKVQTTLTIERVSQDAY